MNDFTLGIVFDWNGSAGAADATPAGVRSMLAFWLGGASGVVPASTTSVAPYFKPMGPAPGSYQRKYYLPPGWKKKKPTVAEVKELYVEARKEIAPADQRGLLPAVYRLEGKSTARLPPPRLVDFAKLRADLATLRGLFDALQQIEDEKREYAEFMAKQARRRREEQALMLILMHI